MELYIWFEEAQSTVHVSVLRARGLPKSTGKKLLSPYVKLSVKPEQKQKAKRKTAVVKNTLEPVWNASFDLVLDSGLTSQTLVLSLMNKGTGKDTTIAKVEFPLLNVACDQAEAQRCWVPLNSQEGALVQRPFTDDKLSRISFGELPIIVKRQVLDVLEPDREQTRKSSVSMKPPAPGSGAMLRRTIATPSRLEETSLEEDLGDVELCLWFDDNVSTLHVRVSRGRGILVKSLDGKTPPTNALVKLEIQPNLAKSSKRRTAIVHDNTDPVWNEDFEFVFDDAIATRSLFVCVVNIDKKLQELGALEIPLLNISDSNDAFPAWYSLLPTMTSFVPLPSPTASASSASSPNAISPGRRSGQSSPQIAPQASPASPQEDPSGGPPSLSRSSSLKRRVSAAMSVRKPFRSEESKTSILEVTNFNCNF